MSETIWYCLFEWSAERRTCVSPVFRFVSRCASATAGTRAGECVRNLMAHVIPAWVDSDPKSWCHRVLGFLSLQVLKYMLSGAEVRWWWPTGRSFSSLLQTSLLLAERCDVWGHCPAAASTPWSPCLWSNSILDYKVFFFPIKHGFVTGMNLKLGFISKCNFFFHFTHCISEPTPCLLSWEKL